jgi:hypothetical protein
VGLFGVDAGGLSVGGAGGGAAAGGVGTGGEAELGVADLHPEAGEERRCRFARVHLGSGGVGGERDVEAACLVCAGERGGVVAEALLQGGPFGGVLVARAGGEGGRIGGECGIDADGIVGLAREAQLDVADFALQTRPVDAMGGGGEADLRGSEVLKRAFAPGDGVGAGAGAEDEAGLAGALLQFADADGHGCGRVDATGGGAAVERGLGQLERARRLLVAGAGERDGGQRVVERGPAGGAGLGCDDGQGGVSGGERAVELGDGCRVLEEMEARGDETGAEIAAALARQGIGGGGEEIIGDGGAFGGLGSILGEDGEAHAGAGEDGGVLRARGEVLLAVMQVEIGQQREGVAQGLLVEIPAALGVERAGGGDEELEARVAVDGPGELAGVGIEARGAGVVEAHLLEAGHGGALVREREAGVGGVGRGGGDGAGEIGGGEVEEVRQGRAAAAGDESGEGVLELGCGRVVAHQADEAVRQGGDGLDLGLELLDGEVRADAAGGDLGGKGGEHVGGDGGGGRDDGDGGIELGAALGRRGGGAAGTLGLVGEWRSKRLER